MATREQFRADRATTDRGTVERHPTADRGSSAERKQFQEGERNVSAGIPRAPVAWHSASPELVSPELAPEPVTAEQIWLVQSSWEKVVPMAPHVAELFFDRLYELDP